MVEARHTRDMTTADSTLDACERNERWLADNRDALESSNAFVEEHGLPLAHLQTRHAVLERQVEFGQRDARSLVAIPADMVRAARLTSPENAFNEPEPW